MNAVKFLTAATMTVALAACTPSPAGTSNTDKNSNTTTEVKKTLSGKLTRRSGVTNAKVLFATVEGSSADEATAGLMNIPNASETDRYPGATVVTPGADGAFSVEFKLGTKSHAGGMLLCWNDANNDNKYSDNEVALGVALTGGKTLASFLLTKTEFKEYVDAQPVDVKASYEFAFDEVKQSKTVKVVNAPATVKIGTKVVEANDDAGLASALVAAGPAPTSFATPTENAYELQVVLGDKPAKATMIVVWDDANSNNAVDEGEAIAKTTGDTETLVLRLTATEKEVLKVLSQYGTTTDAELEYTFTF